jgi:hypothetical protein
MATDYAERQIANCIFGAATLTPPATWHVALFSTAPNAETGASGTEISGNNYSRLAVTNNTTNFPTVSSGSGVKTNAVDLVFATPSGNWSGINTIGFLDASSGGNLWYTSPFPGNATYNAVSGQTVKIPAGSLTLTVT